MGTVFSVRTTHTYKQWRSKCTQTVPLHYKPFKLEWYLLGDGVHDVSKTMHTLSTFEWSGIVCLVLLLRSPLNGCLKHKGWAEAEWFWILVCQSMLQICTFEKWSSVRSWSGFQWCDPAWNVFQPWHWNNPAIFFILTRGESNIMGIRYSC